MRKDVGKKHIQSKSISVQLPGFWLKVLLLFVLKVRLFPVALFIQLLFNELSKLLSQYLAFSETTDTDIMHSYILPPSSPWRSSQGVGPLVDLFHFHAILYACSYYSFITEIQLWTFTQWPFKLKFHFNLIVNFTLHVESTWASI